MNAYLIFSDYIEKAMESAEISEIEKDSFAGKISNCPGVVAFGDTEADCRFQLQIVLEGWMFIKLKRGQLLPIIKGVNLNLEPGYAK